MLVGGILAAVVVVGIIAAAVFRNRSRDDVHSVEHYHRQLHTLEEMRTHSPPGTEANGENGDDSVAFPATAFRVAGSSTVRLTEPGHTIVPPAPPPPVKNPGEPVLFVDSHVTSDKNESSKNAFMIGVDDKAMHSINHRPKRLGALIAMAAVIVLIVVLIVAGMHSNTTPPKHPTSGTATTATTAPSHTHSHSGTAGATGQKSHKSTNTTTTVAPVVSAPSPSSANQANYQVGVAGSYSLVLSATSGDCWVSATLASGNATPLFAGTLAPGESHTVTVTGPVTVVAGAPAAFAASINGVAVQLPFGFQAPFTMNFLPPGTALGSSPGTTTTT